VARDPRVSLVQRPTSLLADGVAKSKSSYQGMICPASSRDNLLMLLRPTCSKLVLDSFACCRIFKSFTYNSCKPGAWLRLA